MSDAILNICGNLYRFRSKLTLSNIKIFIEYNPEAMEEVYRGRIAAVIKNSIITDESIKSPCLEQIVLSDDSVFKAYIGTVISENNFLSPFYINRPEQEDQCERFCKACEDYFHSMMRELAESLSEKLKEVTVPLAELTQKLNPIFSDFQWQMATLSSAFAPALSYISTIGESLSRNLKNFSDNQKKIDWDVWKQSYELWGYYGWAVIDHAPFYFNTHPPENQIDADKKALNYFKKVDLITFWSDLKNHPFSKQVIADIDEAISCFNAKNYKACSILVCTLIDGICIKDQSSDGRLNVGVGAISKINIKFKRTPYGSTMGLFFLYYRNLFRCLFTLFEQTNDFKKEPPRYNRNFVDHGMSKRKVLRKDCIKLFLILHNLMELIEWCHEENEQ